MKSRITWFISLLILMSMLISACGGAATPVAPPPPQPTAVEAVPTPLPEPTQPPVIEASEADLDAVFARLITGMKGYNALKMDAFVEMLAQDPDLFILDVREPNEIAEKGYIEGAIHIPLRTLAKNLDLLPSFDTPIVSYCGVGWRCTIAMTALGALGWTDVKALKDGSFGGWVEAGNPVVTDPLPTPAKLNAASPDPALVKNLDEMLSSIPEGWGVITAEKLATDLVEVPGLTLIDLRKPGEVEENGAIDFPQQVNLAIEDFVNMKSQWPADKNAPIVTYCGTGHRSTIAMAVLWSYGYTNVLSLKGGLAPWVESGYPVVGGKAKDMTAVLDAEYQEFLSHMVKYNTIGLDELNALLAEEPPPFVLDVREVSEVEEKGHIDGAVHVPLRTLAKNLDLLPSFDTPIVSYCGVGWRCTIAMTALGALGWTDVKALKGGSFGGWVEGGYPVVAGAPTQTESLNSATPDHALVAIFDQALSSIPEGWGVVTADNLSAELVENPALILIDARTLAEAGEKGVIEAENHLSMPIEEFVNIKAQLPADKNAEIVVYCGTGHRSTMVMTMLWSYGYTGVRSMKGGLTDWLAAGYKVAELATP
jgi:rhodanese-related sulfurtransferase